jgi:hypothetical protein
MYYCGSKLCLGPSSHHLMKLRRRDSLWSGPFMILLTNSEQRKTLLAAQPNQIGIMASLRKDAPKDLSQTLKVIGAGHPRTGTSSFSEALEILLGHPVMHSGSACMAREEGIHRPARASSTLNHNSFHEVLALPIGTASIQRPARCEQGKGEGRTPQGLRRLRWHCRLSWDVCRFSGTKVSSTKADTALKCLAELADTFPEAVVICTTRDKEK